MIKIYPRVDYIRKRRFKYTQVRENKLMDRARKIIQIVCLLHLILKRQNYSKKRDLPKIKSL